MSLKHNEITTRDSSPSHYPALLDDVTTKQYQGNPLRVFTYQKRVINYSLLRYQRKLTYVCTVRKH